MKPAGPGAAATLLVAVAFAHYMPDILADGMRDPERAAEWLAQIFGVIEALVALFLVRQVFAFGGAWGTIGLFACYVGILEEGQRAVCGVVAFGDEREVPLYAGLCTVHVGGLPYAAFMAAIIVYFLSRSHARKK